MPAPPSRNLRVVKYAPGWGYAAIEWERALAAIDWYRPHAEGGPERLKIKALPDGTRDATVWRATLSLGGRPHEVVLKVEPLATVRKKVQALLRRTKAFRQWRGAVAFASESVPCARCLAVLRSPGLEVLVVESLPGLSLLEAIARGFETFSEERDLTVRLGRVIAHFLVAGPNWPDLKCSNVMVHRSDLGQWEAAFVDTVDVGRRPPRHPLFPLLAEAVGTGLLPRRAARMRFLDAVAERWVREMSCNTIRNPPPPHWPAWIRDHRRQLWHELEEALRAHGDPIPKDDPLARS